MTREMSKTLVMVECLVEASKQGWYTPEDLADEAMHFYWYFNIGGQRKPLKRRCHAWSNARRNFDKTPEEQTAEMEALLDKPLRELLLIRTADGLKTPDVFTPEGVERARLSLGLVSTDDEGADETKCKLSQPRGVLVLLRRMFIDNKEVVKLCDSGIRTLTGMIGDKFKV